MLKRQDGDHTLHIRVFCGEFHHETSSKVECSNRSASLIHDRLRMEMCRRLGVRQRVLLGMSVVMRVNFVVVVKLGVTVGVSSI